MNLPLHTELGHTSDPQKLFYFFNKNGYQMGSIETPEK